MMVVDVYAEGGDYSGPVAFGIRLKWFDWLTTLNNGPTVAKCRIYSEEPVLLQSTALSHW
jgi:hypothetical protein